MIDSPGNTVVRCRHLPRIVLMATLAFTSLAARAGDAVADQVRARQAFQHDLITLLALRADPQPLLGAALLARTRQDPGGPLGFHRLIERASKAPQAGPAVNWVRLSDCDAAAGNCPNPDALKILLAQAPDNAAVWLLRMGQAMSLGDTRSAVDALHRAARAKVYDDYTGRSLQALADSVTLLPPPPATLSGTGDHATRVAALQVMMVYGIGDAQPMPGFQLVAAQCQPKVAEADPKRRALCLDLARVLVWGSSPLARSLGLHLQSTLSTDPDERELADASMRDLTWQIRQFGQLQIRARGDMAVARRLLMLARQGGTEMAIIQAGLRAFAIPVEAPPEGSWLRDDEPPAAAPDQP